MNTVRYAVMYDSSLLIPKTEAVTGRNTIVEKLKIEERYSAESCDSGQLNIDDRWPLKLPDIKESYGLPFKPWE